MGKDAIAEASAPIIPTVKVMLDFKGYDERKFGPFMAKVIKCATNNPYKTVPPEILTDCVKGNDDYIETRTERDASPSTANTQFFEAARERANTKFEVLALWVQDNCDNDRGIVLSFGFKVAKATRNAAKQLAMPSNVRYSYGMPGTIVFKCKSYGQRISYVVEASLDGGHTWAICGISTKSFRIIAQGLIRGKEYIFRIYGENDAGPGQPWTSAGIIAAV